MGCLCFSYWNMGIWKRVSTIFQLREIYNFYWKINNLHGLFRKRKSRWIKGKGQWEKKGTILSKNNLGQSMKEMSQEYENVINGILI